MRKCVFILFLLLFCKSPLFATWSIIIIDPVTKEIGIAGASCTYNCYGIGKIIPNVGAIIVQAMSNNDARAKGVTMMVAQATPEEIIEALQNPAFDPERQQYAVVMIQYFNNPQTFTGDSTKQFNGALTAPGISVQGNTLTNKNQLDLILNAVLKGKNDSLHIAEILMLALEEGSTTGGDSRCGEQRATTAFLTVAKPTDKKPYLNLVIFGQGKGGQNAVHLLRRKFEKWKSKNTL